MKTFKIEATGRTISDIEDAIREALRRIQRDNLSGFDRNEDGSFSFDSSGEFEDDEEAEPFEDIEENRIDAANLEFEKFDFGSWEIEDQNGWEWETPGNVFTRTVYFHHVPNDDFDRDSLKGQFTVTFFPQSAEVQDTTCTVDGNEITTVE